MKVNTCGKIAILVAAGAVAAGCGKKDENAGTAPDLAPAAAVLEYVSANAGLTEEQQRKVEVTFEARKPAECGVGECGIAWVKSGNLEVPIIYQHINGHWYMDGIMLGKDWKPVFKKPQVKVLADVKPAEKEKRVVAYTGDYGAAFLMNADYMEGKPDVGVFCDAGIQYCDDVLRRLSAMNVNIYLWPVGVDAWNREADALILSSPLHLRMRAFHAATAIKGAVKEKDLLKWLQDTQHVYPQKELVERNRKLIARQRKRALDGGIDVVPMVVLPDGKRLRGAVREDTLHQALNSLKNKAVQHEQVQRSDAKKDAGTGMGKAAKVQSGQPVQHERAPGKHGKQPKKEKK